MAFIKTLLLSAACAVIAESLTCTTNTDCTTVYGAQSTCVVLSPCLSGTCACKDNYQNALSDTCVAEKDVGAACTSSSECGDNAACTSSVCACSTYYTAKGNGRDCGADSVAYGGACSADEQCDTELGVCDNGVCGCYSADYGYSYNADNDKCEGRGHGDACSDALSCYYFSLLTCTSDVCECTSTSAQSVDKFSSQGVTYKTCLYDSATSDLGQGETCTTDRTSASAKLCKDSLTCGACPEAPNADVCMESGATVPMATTLALLASVLAYFL